MDPPSKHCIFVGYSNDGKSWQIYYTMTKSIVSSRSATFNEHWRSLSPNTNSVSSPQVLDDVDYTDIFPDIEITSTTHRHYQPISTTLSSTASPFILPLRPSTITIMDLTSATHNCSAPTQPMVNLTPSNLFSWSKNPNSIPHVGVTYEVEGVIFGMDDDTPLG